jgi:CDP-diacylglycerol--glycerol-3-phosphate 3-phosphatidyltransferase
MERLRRPIGKLVAPLVALLVRLGVTADAITVLGCLGTCAVGVIIAMGHLRVSGALFLAVSALDFLDGAVARASGTVRPFGAFLDSLLDRLAEAAVMVGLVFYFASSARALEATLVTLALVGSLAVSYARARAEGLGYDCTVGWLQRPERIVLLGVGLLFHEILLLPALGILVLLTSVTVVQRARHVARLMRPEATS